MSELVDTAARSLARICYGENLFARMVRTARLDKRIAFGNDAPMLTKYACNDSKICYLIYMNKKQASTLNRIFAKKIPSSLAWADIENLLVGCGCTLIQGKGSRVKFVKDDVIGSFHRPHPQKEAKRYQVKDAKEFLEKIGVTP